MKVIVDRFEGGFAVVQLSDKTTANMPKSLLPDGAREGDVLEITIDQEETKQRAEKISRLMDDVWE